MQMEASVRAHTVWWLHVEFALTGVGTTLLGCILPALIAAWHLKDDRAGLLFAAQFTGAALGALLVNRNFMGSVVRGHFLVIASAVSLVFFPGRAQPLLFFSFGLGLGLTMTATSLLVSSMFTGSRSAALSLLNASWAIGAVLSPAFAFLWIRHWPPIYLFLVLAAALAITVIAIGHPRSAFVAGESLAPEMGNAGSLLKLLFLSTALAFLYVGVEVSVSGWMMTYVHRIPTSSKLWPPIAASSFWIALVGGRTLVPTALRWLSEAQLFTSSLAIALVGVVLLLLSHSLPAIVLCVVFAGLALGPVFPLCMAKVLHLTKDSPKAKWIFAVPGLGGAFLAWITGKVSAHDGSLRAGLMVPAAVLLAMIVLHRFAIGQEFARRNR